MKQQKKKEKEERKRKNNHFEINMNNKCIKEIIFFTPSLSLSNDCQSAHNIR
jgi:hypothetical protein